MNDLKVIYTPGGEKELRVLNDDKKTDRRVFSQEKVCCR